MPHDGIRDFIRRNTKELVFSLQAKKTISISNQIGGRLDLGTSSLQNREEKMHLFEPSGLWYFVTAAQTD